MRGRVVKLWGSVGVCCGVLALTGCVDRRYVVTSNVPGAQVTVDGTQLGPTPTDARYEYAGTREFHCYAPGYEPLVQHIEFEPRWYDYPGLDLFAEVFWPFRIEDVRRVHLELHPAQPIPVDRIQSDAEALRARGYSLPPPSVPNDQPAIPSTQAGAGRMQNVGGVSTGTTPIPLNVPGRFGGR